MSVGFCTRQMLGNTFVATGALLTASDLPMARPSQRKARSCLVPILRLPADLSRRLIFR
jgi:hypothetical protein